MKVAIIGAGLAGLACAIQLEKYNIKPVIYERNSFIGEAFSHVSASLAVGQRPIKDMVKYFKGFDIHIKPLNTINRLVHYSPNRITPIQGNFGYFFQRDKSKNDLKNQMITQLSKTEILFNQIGDYEELQKEYDYVVIANGNSSYTEELGCWQQWINTYVRGAVVLGEFDTSALLMWINRDYCKNGYAYMTPFNNHKASLILVVTDANEKEIDHFWEQFIYAENIRYDIVEEYKLAHKGGHVYPHRLNNLFFAGNAGGAIDPFLGFGQLTSVTMGVAAAKSIGEGADYEKLIKKVVKRNTQLYEFRKAFDRVSNKGYDNLMGMIRFPGVKKIGYDTPLNVVKYGSWILKAKSRIMRNRKS
ncbi:MAG: NAD(P)/FAD-dependent oxidoreductase [Clostridia bacterium]|nr:NAD(P)/FAD-dependent oxidoreductase [Clostridia bacterium]